MDFQVWTVMTNSMLLTKVTSEHKKCESQKVQKLHTYVQAYNMIYTIIYPWFFVLSLIVSHSIPIIAYIITFVCVCLHDF